MENKTKRIAVMLVAALAVAAPSALCHDFWLHPGRFNLAPPEHFVVHLLVGEYFSAHREIPLRKEKTERFLLLQPGKTRDLLAETRDRAMPVVKWDVPLDGPALVVMDIPFAGAEMSYDEFLEYLDNDGVGMARGALDRLQPGTVQRERYARFLKTFVKQGSGPSGDLYRRVVDQRLEILLLNDPYVLDVGGAVEVKILLDGKPLADQLVHAVVQDRDWRIFRQDARTDAQGVARFPVESPGIWLVRLIHLRPCGDCEKEQWESFWGAYTFEIPEPAEEKPAEAGATTASTDPR